MSTKFFLKKIFFFLIFFSASAYATSGSSDLFLKANALYKEGNFEQAYNLYQKVSDKNASVYYNLGNCAYKLSQYGYALLYWRKAEKEWGFFNREELINNIILVKKTLKTKQASAQSIHKTETNPLFFMGKKIKNMSFSLMQAVPLLYFQILFLFVWLLLFLYNRYLYKKRQKFLIVVLFMMVALCGSMLAIKYGMRTRLYGVVIQDNAQLMSGPESTYHVLITLPEGKEGLIYKESNGFYKAKINGIIGWIKSGEFKKV